MSLEIRATDDPKSFDLYEDEDGERIGEITYEAPAVEFGELNPECWHMALWSLTGSGKTWGSTEYSIEEAKEAALAEYPDLVAERRELSKPDGPRPRGISIPHGGQPRWRRR